MAITVSDFRTRFPEFADETEYQDARIQLFINDATCEIGTDESHWNAGGTCCYDRAQAYLAAHLLTLGTNSEGGDSSAKVGPVSQKTAGGVSVTRAAMTKDRSDGDDLLASTTYGMQFLSIRNRCLIGVAVASPVSPNSLHI